MTRPRQSWRSKYRQNVAMTRKDADDFSSALKRAFPDIRFLPEDYGAKWSELWRWAPVLNEMRAHKHWDFEPKLMRDPSGDSLIYHASLAVPQQTGFTAWIEPRGWEPRWQWSEDSRLYELVNKPRLSFEFRRSRFDPHPGRVVPIGNEVARNTAPDISISEPPVLDDPDTIATLSGEWLFGAWDVGDSEAEAFVKKVFRIASKVTTNNFRWVDQYTMRPLPGVRSAVHEWAGHDAVRWAQERRHNYLIKLNKPADYDFGDEPEASFEEVERREEERRRHLANQLGITED